MKTILDYFEEQTFLHPNDIAVVFENRCYSYGKIKQIIDGIAKELVIDGVKKGDIVGILLSERSEFTFIYPMAIMKAGAAYLPLDNSYPSERLEKICNIAKIRTILSQNELVEQLIPCFKGAIHKYDVYTIVAFERAQLSYSFPNIDSTDLMVVFFTSGSTGEPKGVLHEHKTVVECNEYDCKLFNINNKDRLLSYVNYYYGFSLRMFQFLIVGATLHIASNELQGDIDRLIGYINKNEISITSLPTPVGYLFCSTVEKCRLRLLTVAGGVMPPLPKQPNFRLISEYGCTEYISASFYEIKERQSDSMLGVPCSNTSFIVADKNGHVVEDGMMGELWISGNCIAREYLNDPELTKAKFTNFDGKHTLKTGDLVCKINEQYKYCGRIDGMIKLNGHRIETNEIENLLLLNSQIRQVCVCVKEIDGIPKLCAYYVTKEKQECVDKDTLKSLLLKKLPEYMIPYYYIKVDGIPLNSHGKFNYTALPTPIIFDYNEFFELSNYTEKEALAIKAFRRILHYRGSISLEDGFYELGGDSLLAMKLISYLRKYGWSISLSQLRKHPSIKDIATCISPITTSKIEESIHGLVYDTPMFSAFMRLNDSNEINHFIVPEFLESEIRIDGSILEKTLHHLVEHHDMLRALVHKGHLEIRKRDACHLFDIQDFTIDSDNKTITKSIIEPIISDFYKKFDVFNGSMLKAIVFHTRYKDYILIGCNHLISDAVSKNILLEDFCSIYSQLLKNQKVSLPVKTDSYKKYCVFLHELKYNMEDNEFNYWERTRNQLSEINLSVATKGNNRSLVTSKLSQESTKVLLDQKLDMQVLLLTALARVCAVEEQNAILPVQLIHHGRDISHEASTDYIKQNLNFDRTIGFFPVYYPIIIKLNKNNNIKEDIKIVENTVRDVPRHGIGFGSSGGYVNDRVPFFCLDYLGNSNDSSTEVLSGTNFKKAKGISLGQYNSPKLSQGCCMLIYGSTINDTLILQAVFDVNAITRTKAQIVIDNMIEQLEVISSCVSNARSK